MTHYMRATINHFPDWQSAVEECRRELDRPFSTSSGSRIDRNDNGTYSVTHLVASPVQPNQAAFVPAPTFEREATGQ
jgi:hypothetical protein